MTNNGQQKIFDSKTNSQKDRLREREFEKYLARLSPEIQQNIRNSIVGMGNVERNTFIDKLLDGSRNH